MKTSTSTAVAIAGVAITGALAYAVYFDYKRRNDTDFRKKLRKEKKKVDKHAAQSRLDDDAAVSPTTEQLRSALMKVEQENVPEGIQEKEQYFLTQVGLGEQLSFQGPAYNLPAALAYYRGLRVYPSPVELIVLYEKSIPPAVFKIVMELMNIDVQKRAAGYYDNFPPRSMNVKIKILSQPVGKKALISENDFKEGDIIYTEMPVVSVLDPDLQASGKYCTHCLRAVEVGTAVIPSSDHLSSVFCSKDCQSKCKIQSQNLLFGLEPVLPSQMNPLAFISGAQGSRDSAQKEFAAFIKSIQKSGPLLVARFTARQINMELSRMIPPELRTGRPTDELPETKEGGFNIYDHIERLRFIDTEASPEELKFINKVFESALTGLEQFLTNERYATLKGKMRYNAIGICYDGGRDDRPAPTERPENVEKTRTPYGTARQIGSGLYNVSSYIAHSCSPSARISFDKGTSELHLIANGDIKKGDEITVAYVDVTEHSEETAEEARRRRRQELARGWKFACICNKCREEAPETGAENLGVTKDESKLEETVARAEAALAQ